MKLLEVKNKVIDSVLDRAIGRIQSLPDDEYLALIGKWLAKVPDNLEGELFVSAADLKRIPGNFIDDLNRNRKAKVCLSKNAVDVKGGFILKTRNYEIDYSLDTIVKNLRPTLIPELNIMLKLSDNEL